MRFPSSPAAYCCCACNMTISSVSIGFVQMDVQDRPFRRCFSRSFAASSSPGWAPRSVPLQAPVLPCHCRNIYGSCICNLEASRAGSPVTGFCTCATPHVTLNPNCRLPDEADCPDRRKPWGQQSLCLAEVLPRAESWSVCRSVHGVCN
jgi:hypothetical protein